SMTSCFLDFVISLIFFIFFFFSSRRRHTRLQGDWSSDVCSSDLVLISAGVGGDQDVDAEAFLVSRVGPDALHYQHAALEAVERRSEERRVGKECRSRWWP